MSLCAFVSLQSESSTELHPFALFQAPLLWPPLTRRLVSVMNPDFSPAQLAVRVRHTHTHTDIHTPWILTALQMALRTSRASLPKRARARRSRRFVASVENACP